jgi:hypothetical protein
MSHQLKIYDVNLKLNLVSMLPSILNFDSYLTKDEPKYFITSNLINEIHYNKALKQQNFTNEEIDGYHQFSRYDESKQLIYQIITKDYLHFEINLYQSHLNLEEVEYVAIEQIISIIFLNHQLITIHASAISFKDEAILFVGNAKVGKSTIANRFITNLDQTIYINDDKPLLNYNQNQLYVYGSPFSGLNKLNNNISRKVHKIIFIEQSNENKVIELDHLSKTKLLFQHLVKPIKEESIDKVVHFIDNIVLNVCMIKYLINNTDDAYHELFEFLTKS